jgi:peptidoglycan/xylan/chitin deacetylase (PgdA/CDA1 family)
MTPAGMTRRSLLYRTSLAAAGIGALGTGAAVLNPEPALAAGQLTRTFSITCDDGPHAAKLGAGINRTELVLDALRREGARGAFFIQTGVSYRGANPIGRELVARMAAEGHTVGVHTGGTIDHESHIAAQKAGRLERELTAACEYIRTYTGHTPKYVRPTFGATDQAVRETYAKVGLTSLLWDVDGDGGRNLDLATLQQRLRNGLGAVAERNWRGTTLAAPAIVLLYHDIQAGTATHVPELVATIRSLAKELDPKHPTAVFRAP